MSPGQASCSIEHPTFWMCLTISSWFDLDKTCLARTPLKWCWISLTVPYREANNVRLPIVVNPSSTTWYRGHCQIYSNYKDVYLSNQEATCGVMLYNHKNILSLNNRAPSGFVIQRCSSLKPVVTLEVYKTKFLSFSVCIIWYFALKKRFYFLNFSFFLSF